MKYTELWYMKYVILIRDKIVNDITMLMVKTMHFEYVQLVVIFIFRTRTIWFLVHKYIFYIIFLLFQICFQPKHLYWSTLVLGSK